MYKIEITKSGIFGAIFIIASMLSMFLIFVIPFWIVLIINAIELFVFIVVWGTLRMPYGIRVVTFILSIVILIVYMISIMSHPEIVCNGIGQHFSDTEIVRKWFFDLVSYVALPNEAELIKIYRLVMGIFFAVLLLFILVMLIRIRRNCYLTLPLSCAGGTIITFFPWYGVFLCILGALYAGTILAFRLLFYIWDNSDDDSNRSSSTYDIYIVKHDD